MTEVGRRKHFRRDELEEIDLESTPPPDPDQTFELDRIIAERIEIVDLEDPETHEFHEVELKQYLVKWTGYPLLEPSWEPVDMFDGGRENTLHEWQARSMREKRRLVEPFDLARWQNDVDEIDAATQLRKKKRREKRRRLGLAIESSSDDTDGSDEEMGEDKDEEEDARVSVDVSGSDDGDFDPHAPSPASSLPDASEDSDDVPLAGRPDSKRSRLPAANPSKPAKRRKTIDLSSEERPARRERTEAKKKRGRAIPVTRKDVDSSSEDSSEDSSEEAVSNTRKAGNTKCKPSRPSVGNGNIIEKADAADEMMDIEEPANAAMSAVGLRDFLNELSHPVEQRQAPMATMSMSTQNQTAAPPVDDSATRKEDSSTGTKPSKETRPTSDIAGSVQNRAAAAPMSKLATRKNSSSSGATPNKETHSVSSIPGPVQRRAPALSTRPPKDSQPADGSPTDKPQNESRSKVAKSGSVETQVPAHSAVNATISQPVDNQSRTEVVTSAGQPTMGPRSQVKKTPFVNVFDPTTSKARMRRKVSTNATQREATSLRQKNIFQKRGFRSDAQPAPRSIILAGRQGRNNADSSPEPEKQLPQSTNPNPYATRGMEHRTGARQAIRSATAPTTAVPPPAMGNLNDSLGQLSIPTQPATTPASVDHEDGLLTCWFWAKRLKCASNCPFEHRWLVPDRMAPDENTNTKAHLTCYFWNSSYCTKSPESCAYSHSRRAYLAPKPPSSMPTRLGPAAAPRVVTAQTRHAIPNETGHSSALRLRPDRPEPGEILGCWYHNMEPSGCRTYEGKPKAQEQCKFLHKRTRWVAAKATKHGGHPEPVYQEGGEVHWQPGSEPSTTYTAHATGHPPHSIARTGQHYSPRALPVRTVEPAPSVETNEQLQTPSPDPPASPDAIDTGQSQLAQYLEDKIDLLFDWQGRPLSKVAFIMFSPEYQDEMDAVVAMLKQQDVKTCNSTTPGAWEYFLNEKACVRDDGSGNGTVLFHSTFDAWDQVPGLADLACSPTRLLNFFQLPCFTSDTDGPLGLRKLYAAGQATLIMDDCFQDYPDVIIHSIQFLCQRLVHGGDTYIVTRPGLSQWLPMLAADDKDGVYKGLLRSLSQHGLYNDNPSSGPPKLGVYSPDASNFSDYAALWERDHAQAADFMADWFAKWAITMNARSRRFALLSMAGSKKRAEWSRRYQHIQVMTPESWLKQEKDRAKMNTKPVPKKQ